MKPDPDRLERAILRTVAYSDIFDYPLSAAEVHRYLDSAAASPDEVSAALDRLSTTVVRDDRGRVALAGRAEIFPVRDRRRRVADRMWPAARRWSRLIGRLPLVRMVAITGALAVDNVDPGDDADLLIVTVAGRVWLCRALVTQAVRAARLGGVELCPNWLLAEDTLELADRSLFAARELAQMVPVAGLPVYRRIRRLNRWSDRYLPNAIGPPVRCDGGDAEPPFPSRLAERLALGRVGAAVDRWDRRRKRREILRATPESTEIVLDASQCKGHVDGHGDRIRRAYAVRLRRLGIDDSAPPPSGAAG